MATPTRQLSLFEPQFDDRIRRVIIGEVIHFAILDVFQFYGSEGSASNPRVYWGRAKKRLLRQGGNVTEVLDWRPDKQNGGKTTPIAPLKFFLRLAQVVEIKEWEHIRRWMAEVAHERLEEETNPELGLERQKQRYIASKQRQGLTEKEAVEALMERWQGKDAFKALMATVDARVKDEVNYGQLVNAEYKAILGKFAAELKVILHTESIRDALPTVTLAYLRAAELTCDMVLKRIDRLTMAQVLRAMQNIAQPLGKQLQEACSLVGIDPITGRGILGEARYGAV